MNNWNILNKEIINCKNCKRLVTFREKIALKKTKRFNHWNYWGKPVVGYGNKKAKLIILGLAPAAHGGNRTGRVFTGDKSAEFLIDCLYKVKLVNQNTSNERNDGLTMYNSYMTPVLKCVPPEDKPLKKEQENCFKFLNQEISFLKNIKVIVALGKIGFDSCIYFFKKNYDFSKNVKFGHGAIYDLPNNIKIFGCYHTSPRNVNTGRINEKKMTSLFKKVLKLA